MTTTDIAIRDIQNITYTVSYHDMVQVWVDNYHSGDTVVIIYDPINIPYNIIDACCTYIYIYINNLSFIITH